jgi:hypothetical protein
LFHLLVKEKQPFAQLELSQTLRAQLNVSQHHLDSSSTQKVLFRQHLAQLELTPLMLDQKFAFKHQLVSMFQNNSRSVRLLVLKVR